MRELNYDEPHWTKAYEGTIYIPLWVLIAFAVAGAAVLVIVFVKRK